MSVGSFLVLGVVHYFSIRKAGLEEADRLSDRALLAIGPVMILAMLASLLHLGNPINAPRAIVNFGTSWLSREILFGVLFAGAGGLFAVMQWRKISTFSVRNVIAWVAVLLGLAHVFSMSQIYRLDTQPVWDTVATPITFFTTTLMLGLLAMGAAFVVNYAYVKKHTPDCAELQCELLRATLRWISIAAIVSLGVEFVVLPVYIAYLASSKTAVGAAIMLSGDYSLVLILRLVLAFFGAGILGIFLYQAATTPGKEQTLSNLAYGAFLLVFSAEVLGRVLFYATHIQIRI
jgi:anaerobic dimethyl sulfoxide reductase subunit C (anchor subunit)